MASTGQHLSSSSANTSDFVGTVIGAATSLVVPCDRLYLVNKPDCLQAGAAMGRSSDVGARAGRGRRPDGS